MDHIASLEAAIRINGTNIILLKELADIYFELREYDKAKKYYQRLVFNKPKDNSLELYDTYILGFNNYNVLLAKMKDYKQALEGFRYCATKKSFSDFTLGNLGFLYQYLGMYDEAEKYYLQLKAIDADEVNFTTEELEVLREKIDIEYPKLLIAKLVGGHLVSMNIYLESVGLCMSKELHNDDLTELENVFRQFLDWFKAKREKAASSLSVDIGKMIEEVSNKTRTLIMKYDKTLKEIKGQDSLLNNVSFLGPYEFEIGFLYRLSTELAALELRYKNQKLEPSWRRSIVNVFSSLGLNQADIKEYTKAIEKSDKAYIQRENYWKSIISQEHAKWRSENKMD